jgi:hypothetical protein
VVGGGLVHGKRGDFGKRCGSGSVKQAGIAAGLLETGRLRANTLSS